MACRILPRPDDLARRRADEEGAWARLADLDDRRAPAGSPATPAEPTATGDADANGPAGTQRRGCALS